ncbi:VOC family protein [Metabacillus malikii]|uniref:Catechol 2,3-dioxygenase-like lactoylglutathione lyase family enzyme n=1 Tax=Metabacillus malikii TaxID=1504265 RepID=A0ABT9ZBG7_9BACI|nr:VOC family protein [Metabacillus malikii]MDQ0229350.1 catechol 2,3-dioxygenase-like lactoylglutathione lyase family enzyme [Metabacillus malikii]
MIKIDSIHHVSLAVKDLSKAKQFYGTILGLQEIARPDFDFPGAWYQVGNQQLHLIVEPMATTFRNNPKIDSKDGHFAIRIQNYEETLTYLKSKGVKFEEYRYSVSGFAQIFCADPDDNLIELNVDQNTLV